MVSISLVLALLTKYGQLTREDAVAICRKLELSTLPTRFEDAERLIEKLLKEAKT